MFIGDGINDAPALAGANVGIANATMARIDANYVATAGINSAIHVAAALPG